MALDQLQQYAAVAWEPDDLIEVRPLQPWMGQRKWVRARDLADHVDQMLWENERGANIYAGILPRNKDGGGTSEDVDGGRVIWADFDGCDPVEANAIMERLELPVPSMLVATGHGTHIFWKLKEWTPKADIAATVAGLIGFLKSHPESAKFIDQSAKDPARILRLPGFINHKEPVANAELAHADPSTVYDLDVFAPFLATKTPEKKANAAPAVLPMPASFAADTARKRAWGYVATIPGSTSPGRNDAAFRAACAIVNDMTVADLNSLLKERDLPVSGKKADLIARLQDSE